VKTYVNKTMGLIYPDRLMCKQPYDAFINVLAPTLFNQQIFAVNDVFDPDVTAALGSSARMFAELSRNYAQWRVYAAKIDVNFVNGSPNIASGFTIVPASDVAALSSVFNALQSPRATPFKIAAIAQRTAVRTKMFMNARTLFGVTKKEYADDLYRGTTTSSPNQLCYFHVCAGPAEGATVSTFYYNVRIVYYVEWYDRKQVRV